MGSYEVLLRLVQKEARGPFLVAIDGRCASAKQRLPESSDPHWNVLLKVLTVVTRICEKTMTCASLLIFLRIFRKFG